MRHPFVQPGGILLRRQQRMESSGIDDPFEGDTLHLDPRKGLKLTSGVVEDWADIVGDVHTATQATASKRPTPGTGPVQLSFDGDDFLTVPDDADLQIANGQNFSIMLGMRYNSGTSGQGMGIVNSAANNAGQVTFSGFDTIISSDNGGQMSFRARDSNQDAAFGAPFTGLVAAGFAVFSGTFNWAANLSWYMNGGTPNTADATSMLGNLDGGEGMPIGKLKGGLGTAAIDLTHVVFDRRLWTAAQHNERGRFIASATGATWVDVS